MRISDWSSDVCSSDLRRNVQLRTCSPKCQSSCASLGPRALSRSSIAHCGEFPAEQRRHVVAQAFVVSVRKQLGPRYHSPGHRSEELTSELQSLMRISYAVFCLKKQKQQHNNQRLH